MAGNKYDPASGAEHRRWGFPWLMRRLAIAVASIVIALALLWFLLTSGTPLVSAPMAPTPEQAGAGQQALLQLRTGLTNPSRTSRIVLSTTQLDGLSALASHGLRPDRIALRLDNGTFHASGSHLLPGGRWLNISIAATGRSAGFPATQITVGKLHLPSWLSRVALESGRKILHLKGLDLPPFDQMVGDVAIDEASAAATIRLPFGRRLTRFGAARIDSAKVVRIYCGLTAMQRKAEEHDFAAVVRRTFRQISPADDPVQFNRAAMVALAMFLVDDRVGELAGTARKGMESCRMPPQPASIHGRSDLPLHWSLSAALAVAMDAQMAEAMGTWKELADSLARQSVFAVGDPSGFSFVDLAADRSGFRIAKVASSPDRAKAIAANLAEANANQLLPGELMQGQERLTEAMFTQQYGSIDDPRYEAAIRHIDEAIDRNGIE